MTPIPTLTQDASAEQMIAGLTQVFTDFTTKVEATPFFRRLNDGTITLEDYKTWLMMHRQQVIEGARWISRAASSVTREHEPLRATFIGHAAREQRDFLMLEEAYEALGGDLNTLQSGQRNVGTEAFHAFMMYRASQPNPFDLLGAMFMIEGLGEGKAAGWADRLSASLDLPDVATKFFRYHGEHDEEHMDDLIATLNSGILTLPSMPQRIVKAAGVVGRLYLLQIEEMV